MKFIKGLILKLLLLVIVFGIVSTAVDYKRITENQKPVFAKNEYNYKTKKQVYKGLFYTLQRTCNYTWSEPLSKSDDYKYKILFLDINIKIKDNSKKEEELIDAKIENKCSESKLIYADKDIKVYTYCIEEIKINIDNKKIDLKDYLKEDIKNINELNDKFLFSGDINNTSKENIEKTKKEDKIKITECINKDIYISPESKTLPTDSCIIKEELNPNPILVE